MKPILSRPDMRKMLKADTLSMDQSFAADENQASQIDDCLNILYLFTINCTRLS